MGNLVDTTAALVDFTLRGLSVEVSLVYFVVSSFLIFSLVLVDLIDDTLETLIVLGGLPVEKLLVYYNWQFGRYYDSISRFCFGMSSSRRIIGIFCSLLNFDIFHRARRFNTWFIASTHSFGRYASRRIICRF